MAPPTYTTDLTTISLVETTTGTWSEFTAYSVGGGPVTNETDYFIQGANCTSATASKSGLASIAYDNGAGITIPTDGAVLVWQYFAAANVLAAETGGGLRIIVGADISNANAWTVGGSDFSPNPYGGWNNVAVNPASVTADYTHGTGNGGTYRWFGSGISGGPGAVGKGNPHGLDAMRYGRGEARMADGVVGDPATFAGFAATNDSISNRWGLIQTIAGGYKAKGLVIFGYVSAVYFSDSNKSILIDNTKKVTANFNTFEVRQSGSTVILNAVNISALGTVSPGRWVTTDNATQTITSCTFTSMGAFGYASNSSLTSNTYRTCGLVTQNSATFTGCIFASSSASASVLSNNPAAISTCSFTSDGSNHGLELTTACAGNSYTFSGNTFTNYASSDGTTGNEMIYNNSAGAVTINVTNSGTYPISIRNGSGASTTVTSSVTVTITVKDSSGTVIPGVEVAIFQDNAARTVVLASTATNASGVVSTSVASGLGAIIVRARQSTNIATFNTTSGVATGTDIITTDGTNHKFQTGDQVVYSRNGGTFDIGPEPGTYYINRISDTTIYLYDTAANAITGTGTGRQDLISSGGGETHTLNPVRYVANSATGTVGAIAFSLTLTMITDSIATG